MEKGPQPPHQEKNKIEINVPFIIMTRPIVDGGASVHIPVFKSTPSHEEIKLILNRTESEYYAVAECENNRDAEGEKRMYIYTRNGKRYKDTWFPITESQKELL
jgi:hypothetical protein